MLPTAEAIESLSLRDLDRHRKLSTEMDLERIRHEPSLDPRPRRPIFLLPQSSVLRPPSSVLKDGTPPAVTRVPLMVAMHALPAWPSSAPSSSRPSVSVMSVPLTISSSGFDAVSLVRGASVTCLFEPL